MQPLHKNEFLSFKNSQDFLFANPRPTKKGKVDRNINQRLTIGTYTFFAEPIVVEFRKESTGKGVAKFTYYSLVLHCDRSR